MEMLSKLAQILGFDPSESESSASLAGRRYRITSLSDTFLSTGDPYLDTQHALLIALVQRLHAVSLGTTTHHEFLDLVREVRKYLEFHFLSEENWLRAARDPELSVHAQQHSDMLSELSVLIARVQGDRISARAVRDFLIAWLTEHVQREAQHLRERSLEAPARPERWDASAAGSFP
jgi:hemerythrin